MSTAAVCIILRYGKKYFSYWGTGVVSAALHNMGQLFAACIVSGTASLINYGKYLLIFSLITGTVTGITLLLIVPRVEKFSDFYKKDTKNKKEMET